MSSKNCKHSLINAEITLYDKALVVISPRAGYTSMAA
jgi:hypothetical protein